MQQNPGMSPDMKSRALNKMQATEELKKLVCAQLHLATNTAMTLADMNVMYQKMGLYGHSLKMKHKSVDAFSHANCWRDYYFNLFEEMPNLVVSYTSKRDYRSIDDAYYKLHACYTEQKLNLDKIYEMTSMYHFYESMDLLHAAKIQLDRSLDKLESRIKREKTFGMQNAYLLERDDYLRRKYRCKEHKHNSHEYSKMHNKEY